MTSARAEPLHRPSLAVATHTTDETNRAGPAAYPREASCPTCGGPVTHPRTGRPRIYCTAACRREMYAQIAELIELEAQLAEARRLVGWAHNDMWRRHHQRTVEWLRLAVVEARSRIPASIR